MLRCVNTCYQCSGHFQKACLLAINDHNILILSQCPKNGYWFESLVLTNQAYTLTLIMSKLYYINGYSSRFLC